MIDFETQIFNEVSGKVRETYPDMYMVGEYVPSPSTFPCISLVEIDNAPNTSTRTQGTNENHSNITYEVNVYSNLSKGKKAQAKELVNLVDEAMNELGFTRTMLEPITNLADSTIYRMVGRYRAIIDANGTIYRR